MKQPANLRHLIVKFIHQGKEFLPPARATQDCATWDDERRLSGIRSWNNEKDHKRKFLISKGKYRSSPNGKDVSGLLTFWGEWEPQSRFRKLNTPTALNLANARYPSYIHEPFLVEGSTGLKNTDPFVFGREFWYTNCQQPTKPNKKSALSALDAGSIILFGTHYDEGFALDTLFVVGSQITPDEYLENRSVCPEQLRIATLDHYNMAENNRNFVFYRGKTPNGGEPFSFVPCRAYNDVERGHQRVLLGHKEFDLPMNSQGWAEVKYEYVSERTLPSFWKRVANHCCAQNYLLGHSFELPPIQRNPKGIEPSPRAPMQPGCAPAASRSRGVRPSKAGC